MVTHFEVLQGDGLAFLAELGLVIDYDNPLTAAAIDGYLVAVNRSNFAARACAFHASAPTRTPIAARAIAAAFARPSRPAATLESLELFLGDSVDALRGKLLGTVGGAAYSDVVTNFQIFQREFLRLRLSFLPLAEMSLVVYHYGLCGSIRLLDFKAIDSHGSDGAQHWRGAAHPSMWLILSLSWGALLRGHSAGKA